MKKLYAFTAMIVMLVAATAYTTTSGGGGISKGELYVNYKFPDTLTISKTVLFPTEKNVTPSWASDSVNIKVGEFYTYVELDTMRGTRRVKLSTHTYVTGGATLVINACRDTTTRSLIVIKSDGSDTISVTVRKRVHWFYTGSKWVPCGSY